MLNFNFPEIKTSRTNQEQANKILDEVKEFFEEFSDEEAVDVLHATETFIRIHFKGREEILQSLIEQVKDKNEKRGYYVKSCY